MRILITGTSGQVGWELRRTLACLGEVICLSRSDLDLSVPESIADAIRKIHPDIVVNPAAYTAVDKAETEPELARTINTNSVAALAKACASINALLVHYSTDYVFDGQKTSAYEVDDLTAPTSVYGQSKRDGELAIIASGVRHLIIRTAWVYGGRGKNFLLTMLKLARERDELRVVADQFGAPTWSRMIAEGTAQLLRSLPLGATPVAPLIHLTNSGSTSWHGFASAIVARGAELGLCKAVPIIAIPSSAYPTPAKRPEQSQLSLSVLENTYGVYMPSWQDALDLCLADIAAK